MGQAAWLGHRGSRTHPRTSSPSGTTRRRQAGSPPQQRAADSIQRVELQGARAPVGAALRRSLRQPRVALRPRRLRQLGQPSSPPARGESAAAPSGHARQPPQTRATAPTEQAAGEEEEEEVAPWTLASAPSGRPASSGPKGASRHHWPWEGQPSLAPSRSAAPLAVHAVRGPACPGPAAGSPAPTRHRTLRPSRADPRGH
jgi:hypothetical protein